MVVLLEKTGTCGDPELTLLNALACRCHFGRLSEKKASVIPMKITAVTEADPKIMTAVNNLLPQLSATSTPLTLDVFEQIVASTCSTLFIATQNGVVAGALTLVLYRIPTRSNAWIEDLVVAESTRGQGVGSALVCHAIDQAKKHGAHQIGLTSAPERIAANRLYQKLGFKTRHTNVYQLSLAEESR